MTEETVLKECACCHHPLPLEQFYKNKKGKLGRAVYCRACYKEKYRQKIVKPAQPDGYKKCSDCGHVKLIERFPKNSSARDGRRNICGVCFSKRYYKPSYKPAENRVTG